MRKNFSSLLINMFFYVLIIVLIISVIGIVLAIFLPNLIICNPISNLEKEEKILVAALIAGLAVLVNISFTWKTRLEDRINIRIEKSIENITSISEKIDKSMLDKTGNHKHILNENNNADTIRFFYNIQILDFWLDIYRQYTYNKDYNRIVSPIKTLVEPIYERVKELRDDDMEHDKEKIKFFISFYQKILK